MTSKQLVQKVKEANQYCADCKSPQPDGVSLNLGVLVCITCSGVHRSLGVHISKVRSLSLDSLTDREARLFLALGNDHMNHIWEKGYSIKLHPKRPDPDSDRTIRDKWIRCKYIEKQFLENCQSKLSQEKNN